VIKRNFISMAICFLNIEGKKVKRTVKFGLSWKKPERFKCDRRIRKK
jgi:hypothetical protein